MKRLNVKETVADLLREHGELSSGALGSRLGISRQTAYLRLAGLVAEGELVRVGAGRGARYRRAARVVAQGAWPRESLAEDAVWRELETPIRSRVSRANVRSILRYGLTEMVNNAIDHSRGGSVAVRVVEPGDRISFEVEDDGVGIFAHVMEARGLASPFEAVAELQKGKVTTMPEAHTGEGIFFTSRMADRMTIESGTTRWVIDGRKGDQAIETAPARVGTLVHFEIAKDSGRTTLDVFGSFTNADVGFSRSRTSIKLFREGDEIVSRSEARRLLAGLERFEEVQLDFHQVRGIGQGFADEVFRVWQREHPMTKLVVANADPAVRFTIDRARHAPPAPSVRGRGSPPKFPSSTAGRPPYSRRDE